MVELFERVRRFLVKNLDVSEEADTLAEKLLKIIHEDRSKAMASEGLAPRNDYVLLRLVEIDKTDGGVVLPERSNEAKEWHVVACGPKVTDLQPGDIVMPIGAMGEDIARVPRSKSLYITREANILIVVGKGE